MRTGIASAVLLAALAAPAPAQSATVSLTHDDDDGIVNVGDTVTWTLQIHAQDNGDTTIISELFAKLHATAPVADVSDFVFSTSFNGGSNGGISDGTGFDLLNFTNGFMGNWQTPADHRNPLPIGAFTTTATATGSLMFGFEQGVGVSAYGLPITPFLSVEHNAFMWSNYSIDEVAFDLDSLTIVPAPASALLLAPAGLLATRRRR